MLSLVSSVATSYIALRPLDRQLEMAALNQVRAGGCPVKDEDVAHLSPLVHEHVSMLGRYSFSGTGGSGQRRVASPA